jgi:hypothetical protein
MSTSPLQVAIIGAGLAGLSCAQHLHQAGYAVKLFDKARGVGGRLSTRRTETTSFDHGAQYFTARDPDFCAQVALWQQQGVASRWDQPLVAYQSGQWSAVADQPRYVGVPRMNAIARQMCAELPCELSHRLLGLHRVGDQWHLQFEGDLPSVIADQVVLAIPAPQVLPLLAATHPFYHIAQSVFMQPTWAVMLELAQPIDVPFAGAFINQQACLSWIAQNHQKPARASTPSWVLHSAPTWAMAHAESDPQWVAAHMIAAFESVLGQQVQIKQQMVHRWLYALAEQPLNQHSLYDPSCGLGIAGDWLHGSRVEGAWCSGRHLAQAMMAAVA